MERVGMRVFTCLEVGMVTLLVLLSFIRLDAEEKELDGGSFLFAGLSERVAFWDILVFGRRETNKLLSVSFKKSQTYSFVQGF